MQDLATRLIPAHSAQAKGRIERLFDTLQDRLVKEMRLANISTPEEANIFLKEIFIPKFNKKFGVIRYHYDNPQEKDPIRLFNKLKKEGKLGAQLLFETNGVGKFLPKQ